jgi:tellurite resistance protein TehA-like permease
MISSVSNFDKGKAVILGIGLYIFIVVVINEVVYHFIGKYIVYPSDMANLQRFNDFVSIIGFLLSLSISTYYCSKGKVKDFAKFSLKFFGIFFILGIALFLGMTFFTKHISSMGGYTALALFFYLLNVFERLNKD